MNLPALRSLVDSMGAGRPQTRQLAKDSRRILRLVLRSMAAVGRRALLLLEERRVHALDVRLVPQHDVEVAKDAVVALGVPRGRSGWPPG